MQQKDAYMESCEHYLAQLDEQAALFDPSSVSLILYFPAHGGYFELVNAPPAVFTSEDPVTKLPTLIQRGGVPIGFAIFKPGDTIASVAVLTGPNDTKETKLLEQYRQNTQTSAAELDR